MLCFSASFPTSFGSRLWNGDVIVHSLLLHGSQKSLLNEENTLSTDGRDHSTKRFNAVLLLVNLFLIRRCARLSEYIV